MSKLTKSYFNQVFQKNIQFDFIFSAGATPEEIVKALQESMKATGASPEEIAKTVLTAMASSGADPEEIAKTMQALLEDSGKHSCY